MATYWNKVGKYQELIDRLATLVPREGECPKNSPALERFRVASNAYYDLYNNGLCNRAAEFRKAFGFSGVKFARDNFNDATMEAAIDAQVDVIVLLAAREAGI